MKENFSIQIQTNYEFRKQNEKDLIKLFKNASNTQKGLRKVKDY